MDSSATLPSALKTEIDHSETLIAADLGNQPDKFRHKSSTKSQSVLRETIRESILLEDKVKYLIVSDISQEIVNTALDLIYEKYLEKQTVYFVSHCARLAWKALVEWNFQQKDRGGFREGQKDQLDVEPKPSPQDAWAGQSVAIGSESRRISRSADMEAQSEDVLSVVAAATGSSSRRNTVSHVSLLPRLSRQQTHSKYTKYSKYTEKTNKDAKQKKSEDIPRLEGKTMRADDGRKDTYELPAPVPLQTKHFPSTRVEVQYAIMPGHPSKGTNLAGKKDLVTKTIVLKKPQGEDNKNQGMGRIS